MDDVLKAKVTAFFTQYKPQNFKKGEILIRADDDPTGIYFIKEGIVRTYYISKNGDEITLNMFKPTTFFPMSWAMSDIHNQRYYEAMTDILVYKAPKEDVLQFIRKEPGVMFDLLRRVYIGVEGLWMQIEHLSTGSALEKLTSILLILGRRFGVTGEIGTQVTIKMTEKELGEYAGMYRETVSRELAALRKKGLLVYEKGVITIPDISKLEGILSL